VKKRKVGKLRQPKKKKKKKKKGGGEPRPVGPDLHTNQTTKIRRKKKVIVKEWDDTAKAAARKEEKLAIKKKRKPLEVTKVSQAHDGEASEPGYLVLIKPEMGVLVQLLRERVGGRKGGNFGLKGE